VAVLEALSRRLQQGLHELGLANFAEEAKSVSANVFVGMLQIQSNSVATVARYWVYLDAKTNSPD
jgi:hypothetical protein